MTLSRRADLSARFNAWLARFSPPRNIAGNPEAMKADAASLFRIFLENAPDEDWQDWWDAAIRMLEADMLTRSWPSPGAVVRACRGAAVQFQATGKGSSRAEENAIQMLTDWYRKFHNEMPGMGRSGRTRTLIRRGVLRDEREAKFRGFTLSPEDAAQAGRVGAGAAEMDHHATVMARWRGPQADGARRG